MVLATVDIEILVEEVLQGTRGGVEKTQGQSQVEVSTSVVSSNFS